MKRHIPFGAAAALAMAASANHRDATQDVVASVRIHDDDPRGPDRQDFAKLIDEPQMVKADDGTSLGSITVIKRELVGISELSAVALIESLPKETPTNKMMAQVRRQAAIVESNPKLTPDQLAWNKAVDAQRAEKKHKRRALK